MHDDRARPPDLPIDVRVLPEQRQISAVARQLHGTKRSYPLPQVAALFVDKPAACYFRIEADRGDPVLRIYRCKSCGAVAASVERLQSHLQEKHIEEFFAKEEMDVDPPKGEFTCVSRCGLSGCCSDRLVTRCEEKIVEVHGTHCRHAAGGVPEQDHHRFRSGPDRAVETGTAQADGVPGARARRRKRRRR